MTWIALFVTAALAVISLTTIINLFLFPRLKVRAASNQPFVSVLIPARNESEVIGQTVKALLAQHYPHFEVIVLDDNSTDGTREILSMIADERLQVVGGAPLPYGWMGKNWACHQLKKQAQGDILVFTDADVRWSPEALNAVVTHTTQTQADLFTVWPTQQTVTWGERLVVPLMSMVVVGYLPIVGTHYVPISAFGAANGQCMVWRKSAYEAIGGHESVRDNVLEDVTMARMVKANHMRLRMADGNHLVACRMYQDWKSVRDGYAKNILAGYGNNVLFLILGAVFHWLLFLFPLVWVFTLPAGTILLWCVGLIVVGLSIRALTAAFTHQRWWDAVLMPVSVILMTCIAAQAIYWHYRYGGPQWKGRIVQRQPAKRQER